MDDSRFDALARSLTTAGSRRRALGGLFASALGLLSRGEADDAVAHDLKAKCKKKSGDAKKKCLKKAKKHAAEHASETSPPPPGLDPCAGTPDDAPCNGDGRCLQGICNSPPGCNGAGGVCTPPGACCSGMCSEFCLAGGIGTQCRVAVDCQSGRCRGYRCVP